jgi:hypothetical protein
VIVIDGILDAKRTAIITGAQRSGNMTIDDVKEELISILTEIEMTGGSMVTSIYKDELKMAIDAMRKYQKIEEIMSADLEHIHPLDRDKYIVASIKEVLENGNDD